MDRSGANTGSRIFRTYWALDTYRIKGNEGSTVTLNLPLM